MIGVQRDFILYLCISGYDPRSAATTVSFLPVAYGISSPIFGALVGYFGKRTWFAPAGSAAFMLLFFCFAYFKNLAILMLVVLGLLMALFDAVAFSGVA